jgi:pimeloyl-ACP methyl ester carboxylesterase
MIKYQKLFFPCLLLLSAFSSLKISAQVILPFKTTPKSVIGYVEYTPPDYNTNTKKYPLVIFLHGKGESGPASNDPAVLKTGYNSLVFYGPPKFVKLGTNFPFLLVCPQLKNNYGNWPSSYVMEVIEHVKTYLRVDVNRIYLTGTSLGGGGAWITAQDYPDYFAAVAPVAGSTNSTSKACPMAASHLPVWAFHGDADGTVPLSTSSRMVNAINACGASPAAKLTIYPGLGHNAYSLAYDPTHAIHNPNLYDWMMAQVNNGGTIPSDMPPVANAGPDKTIALPTTAVTLSGSATDPDGTVIDYSWVKVSGGNGTLSKTRTPNLQAYGLEAGSYVFRLTVTDNYGKWHADDVTVKVSTTGTVNASPIANAGADKTLTLPTNSITLSGTGSDTDGSITAYKWTKVSGGAATLGSTTSSSLALSGLVAGSYVFRLTVTDDKSATASDDVTVQVSATGTTNASPVANAGANKTLTLPTNSITLIGTGSDTDGKITAYKWTKVSGGTATLGSTTASSLALSGLVSGTYVFRLTVTDDKAATASDDVTVVVNTSSGGTTTTQSAPVADAGGNKTIKLPVTSVVLNGSATTYKGTIVSYKWEQIYGAPVTLQNATTPNLTLTGVTTPGTRIFKLTVKNSINYSDYSQAKIVFE